jgi:hypothetical protein
MQLTDLNLSSTNTLLEAWECLPGFPRTEPGRKALVKTALRLAAGPEQLLWLVDKVADSCERSPTPIQMRRIFCQKYPPADGTSDIDMWAGACE